MVRQPAVVQAGDLAARQQFGAVAFLPHARVGELLQYVRLVGIARQHQGAIGPHVEARLGRQVQP
ncbi:hypothetical protein D3C77_804690 [compost metagenome]